MLWPPMILDFLSLLILASSLSLKSSSVLSFLTSGSRLSADFCRFRLSSMNVYSDAFFSFMTLIPMLYFPDGSIRKANAAKVSQHGMIRANATFAKMQLRNYVEDAKVVTASKAELRRF